MLPTILVVEDSSLVLKIIRHVCQQQTDFDVHFAESFAQARQLVENAAEPFFAALVDLNLPDAPNGEVVDFTISKKIATVVLTGTFDEKRREQLLSKGIADYVTKEGRFSYEYALSVVKRLYRNLTTKVLVVDDSDTSRVFIKRLLASQLFTIVEARNGMEAVKVFLENPDIKLLITDYNMPKMNGVELIQNIRYKHEKSDLAIIGLSGEGEGNLSAQFIKCGANDFLRKPFNHEEFHCRIRHNIEALEHIELIRESANRDYLTGVYNRRYFFRRGEELYAQAKASNSPMAAVVLDVDHFKKINDRLGYEGGDYVLAEFSKTIQDAFNRFLIARPGGEEFFMLLPGVNNEQAMTLMGSLQDIVTHSPIAIGEDTVVVSFSAGVSNQLGDSLQDQLNTANGYLYRAKEAGRRLVIGDDGEEVDGDDY